MKDNKPDRMRDRQGTVHVTGFEHEEIADRQPDDIAAHPVVCVVKEVEDLVEELVVMSGLVKVGRV